MKKKQFIFILFLLFIFSKTTLSVDEFDIKILNDRLNRLEQEISDMQKSLYVPEENLNSNDMQSKGAIGPKHERRINKLENDFAKITGQFEEIFFRIEQLQDKLDKLSSDLEFRLSNQPNVIKKTPTQPDTYAYPDNRSEIDATGGDTEILGMIKSNGSNDEVIKEISQNFQTPDDLFNYGKESLRNLNYEEAEIAFKAFLGKHPKDNKTPEAQYWIAESLFVRDKYDESILAYGQVIKKYKKSEKAPDSLLKIGIAFKKLDKNKEACNALQRVEKQYPDSDQRILKKASYEIQQINC